LNERSCPIVPPSRYLFLVFYAFILTSEIHSSVTSASSELILHRAHRTLQSHKETVGLYVTRSPVDPVRRDLSLSFENTRTIIALKLRKTSTPDNGTANQTSVFRRERERERERERAREREREEWREGKCWIFVDWSLPNLHYADGCSDMDLDNKEYPEVESHSV